MKAKIPLYLGLLVEVRDLPLRNEVESCLRATQLTLSMFGNLPHNFQERAVSEKLVIRLIQRDTLHRFQGKRKVWIWTCHLSKLLQVIFHEILRPWRVRC